MAWCAYDQKDDCTQESENFGESPNESENIGLGMGV